MKKARLVKRKVFTPMGKPDKHTYDVKVGKRVRTRAVSYNRGRAIVKQLNKRR